MAYTHKYIPRIPQREDNLFLEEYYSGTDVKIFIDDTEQTEVAYISYSLNEQLKPIYGYSSRTFDDVSVGNRIVTGVIKIPIKNYDTQDDYDTIINKERSTLEEIEQKNKNEQQNKRNTEWTNNTTPTQEESNNYSSNQVFEYQNKLINLGYNGTMSGRLDKDTRLAIKRFQEEHSLSQVNYFNSEIMSEIDLQIQLKNQEIKTINSNANVYYGLSITMGTVTVLSEGDRVYVINDFKNGFTQIRTLDGKDGYVESSRLS